MFVREITYLDLDGNEQTKKFQFHLFKHEVHEMEASHEGGLQGMINRISTAKTHEEVVKTFQTLILSSYGVREGDDFIKDEALTKRFKGNPAFDQLYVELATDEKKGAEFIIGILPKDVGIDSNDLTKEKVAEALGTRPPMPKPPTT